MSRGGAGGLQQLGLELHREELVGLSLVDEERQSLRRLRHQLHRVVRRPGRPVFAEVRGEGLLSPRHPAGRHDGREGRDAAVAARVAQGERQRAVASHGVAREAARLAGGEVLLDERRQLLHHVVLHLEVRGPGRAGGVEVEARPLAQVVTGLVGHALAAGAGVGRHQNQPEGRRVLLRAGLGDEVLLGAGQPREPVHHRAASTRERRWRQVHRHLHLAAQRLRGVLPHLLPAAEAAVLLDALHPSGLPEGALGLRGVGGQEVHQRGAQAVVGLELLRAQRRPDLVHLRRRGAPLDDG